MVVVGPAATAELDAVLDEEDDADAGDDALAVVVVTLEEPELADFESLLHAARTNSRPTLMTIDRFMPSPTAEIRQRIAPFRDGCARRFRWRGRGDGWWP